MKVVLHPFREKLGKEAWAAIGGRRLALPHVFAPKKSGSQNTEFIDIVVFLKFLHKITIPKSIMLKILDLPTGRESFAGHQHSSVFPINSVCGGGGHGGHGGVVGAGGTVNLNLSSRGAVVHHGRRPDNSPLSSSLP